MSIPLVLYANVQLVNVLLVISVEYASIIIPGFAELLDIPIIFVNVLPTDSDNCHARLPDFVTVQLVK